MQFIQWVIAKAKPFLADDTYKHPSKNKWDITGAF
jgi:hypothetical protein